MDWMRRMMGYPDGRSDGKGIKNPTWEEIIDSGKFNDRAQPPDGPFRDFSMGGSYSFSMGDAEDSFSSVFGQMDDMFRQLDTIMQHFHGHPGHMIITEGPGTEEMPESESPRDSFLKKPDDDLHQRGLQLPPHHFPPGHRSPFRGPIISDPNEDGDHHDEGHGHFDHFQDFGMVRDPFDMMEEFFKGFGGGFSMMPFGENYGGTPMLSGPEDELGENPRDAFVKKDTDLDDRVTGGFSDLLKDMPQYNPPVIPGQPSMTQPERRQIEPGMQQRFHSTSIVRVRRPDGSFEETRKYTDSTGREEVTVTRSEPEAAGVPGSLLRQGEPGNLDEHSHPRHYLPSIFSWFSTR